MAATSTEASSPAPAVKDYQNLSIVIPAFNEEDGILATLETLRGAFPAAEIIVVDDGSNDQTAERVAGFPEVKLLVHRFNRGYGGALKTGMSQASRELIAWFDADNEHRAEFLQAMVDQIEREKLAAVLGQRPKSVSVVRGVGKYVIRLLARLLKVKSGSDLNCGLRVFRREVILPYIPVLPDSYSASLTSTIILIEQRYPFAFHPIEINQRIGQSKVALADGFNTMLLVLRVITLFAPMRIFLRVSFNLLLLGLAYSLYIALTKGEGIPVLGAFVMLVGLLVGVLGLVADQISQLRLVGLTSTPLNNRD
ncbi:glycosyltransferase family 2 protein [Pelagibius sp.]|uniref:glycosyltransferase family 2 protein n=1 Tax=Pelagibius sp. TaxID=1931238 RepID=UPI00262DCAE7|nr:glycosyltransferase family 2 protein [Pelagibius sp.]